MATKTGPEWMQGASGTIASADTFVLGDTGPATVGTWVVQATNNAFSGSVTVKGRKRASTAAFVPIPYVRRNLGGTVSDDTSVTAALTGAFLIEINAAGLEIALDCTSAASGSLTIDAIPLRG